MVQALKPVRALSPSPNVSSSLTSKVTGAALSLIVRSPVSSAVSSPVRVTLVEVKLALGQVSAVKKSSDCRWSVKPSMPVQRPVSGRVTLTEDFSIFSASYISSASQSVK